MPVTWVPARRAVRAVGRRQRRVLHCARAVSARSKLATATALAGLDLTVRWRNDRRQRLRALRDLVSSAGAGATCLLASRASDHAVQRRSHPWMVLARKRSGAAAAARRRARAPRELEMAPFGDVFDDQICRVAPHGVDRTGPMAPNCCVLATGRTFKFTGSRMDAVGGRRDCASSMSSSAHRPTAALVWPRVRRGPA